MSRLPQWVGGLGAGLTRLVAAAGGTAPPRGGRGGGPPGGSPSAASGEAGDPDELRRAGHADAPAAVGSADDATARDGAAGTLTVPRTQLPEATDGVPQPARNCPRAAVRRPPETCPRRPPTRPPSRPGPDPVDAVPWGVRVAAEAGWRLLVLAGTLWVLMRVISAIATGRAGLHRGAADHRAAPADRGPAAPARAAARARHRAHLHRRASSSWAWSAGSWSGRSGEHRLRSPSRIQDGIDELQGLAAATARST